MFGWCVCMCGMWRMCVCVFWWVADPETRPSLASGDGMKWIWPTPNILHISSLLFCSGACSESATHTHTHSVNTHSLLFLLSDRSIFIQCFTYACIYSQGRGLVLIELIAFQLSNAPPSLSLTLFLTLSLLPVWMGVVVSWLDNANTLFITLCTFSPLYGIA